MKKQLHAYLNRYVSFSEEEINSFFDYLTVQTFQKKEFILKEGDVCKMKFFITKGLIRIFKIDDKGNENIIHFGIEDWWMTNMESFITEQSSLLYIQALEETTLLTISKTNLEKAYAVIPKLERLFRIITEKMFIAIERKNEHYLKMNSKERYRGFIDELKDFSQRVPQYMIASYLHITPEYLSELRKTK
ncbi:Crp/Fnr family transcriptional regulator [Flavivirga rizhaonensis]|uniref:Crp/Fnr family transcriptional regulator n=1 Tax=Flavivirga rizhaonensis TaxID=2559571 RepID=A0A4S1DR23_9FLAO|nr:Crp/Fnr family transcriptional regulator [Flavivirga rizhaonensis]TGV00370.1 Crp/Fnr family transcriptional regulator [Flavivirga rizhaonensis]